MNRLVRGSVLFAAAVTAWACGGLDTGDIDTTEELVADPNVVFVTNTDSQAVFVEALNSDAQQLEGDFAVTAVGTGLVAFIDESFAPIGGLEGNPTRVRIFVKSTDSSTFVNSSFTVEANGKSLVVPVNIIPGILRIAFPNVTPALGEPITLTAPTNVVFTSATTITVGGSPAAITGLSADSTQITFLLGPNINLQVATITDIGVTYLPNNSFDVTTTGSVTTPTVTSFPATFSSATPDVGDTVTMTLGGLFRALPTVSLTWGATAAIITDISADSTVVSFLPPPGATGAATVANVIVTGVPVPIELPSSSTLAVTTTSSFTGTDDPATAPVLPTPPSGGVTSFFDLGVFTGADITGDGGVGAQYYEFTLAQADTIDITLEFGTSGDMDLVVCEDVACNSAIFDGATGSHPEHVSLELAAGTYWIAAINWDGGTYPFFRIDIENLEP